MLKHPTKPKPKTVLAIRIPEDLKKRIEQAAWRNGKRASEYVRDLLLQQVPLQ